MITVLALYGLSSVGKDCKDEGLEAVITEKECKGTLQQIRKIHKESTVYEGLSGSRNGRTRWCYLHGQDDKLYYNEEEGGPNGADYQVCKIPGMINKIIVHIPHLEKYLKMIVTGLVT